MSEVRFDCQGLGLVARNEASGLVARNEASILVFDTKPVLYRPVLDQIQFCNFDRGCKPTAPKPALYLLLKPVLKLNRFWIKAGFVA